MNKILLFGLIFLLVAGFIGYKIYHKPHQNIQTAAADYRLTATELFTAFDENEKAANAKYLDKIISVTGEIAAVAEDDTGQVTVTLDGGGMLGGVVCKSDNFSENGIKNPRAGEEITLKCKCTGMLMDVVLVRCVKDEI